MTIDTHSGFEFFAIRCEQHLKMPEQASLARALFDNVAESPHELSFRKGDVLQVLNQNPRGLQGWWLCQANGRQGLAAANRLKALKMETATADYDVPKPILPEKTRGLNGSALSENTYDVLRSLNWQPDSPPSERSCRLSAYFGVGCSPFSSPSVSSGSSSGGSRLSYVTSDFGLSERNSAEPPSNDIYDVLRNQARKVSGISSPEPPNPSNSLNASKVEDYDYIDADLRVSPTQPEEHYDRLPYRNAQLPRKVMVEAPLKKKAEKRNSFQRLYDALPAQKRPVSSSIHLSLTDQKSLAKDTDTSVLSGLSHYRPLYITKQAAVTRISCMQSQVQTELLRLFSFVSNEKWREAGSLELKLIEVKLCCEYLVTHLANLVRFVIQAAKMSPQRSSDGPLDIKLRTLIDAVYFGCEKIRKHLQVMNDEKWTANQRTVKEIEQIVTTGQTLTEDVRKMTAFVLGNAQLIFSEEEDLKVQKRPLPITPYRPSVNSGDTTADDDESHEYEDVDYGNISAPLQPRSPTLERKILNSYIAEVNEQVALIRPLIYSFIDKMFEEQTVTSVSTIEIAETIAMRTSKLTRLTDSVFRNLTLAETLELRDKLKKTGGYISTAYKRFNLELRTATKNPDNSRFRNVKSSLDYLNELCQFLKNATETEV